MFNLGYLKKYFIIFNSFYFLLSSFSISTANFKKIFRIEKLKRLIDFSRFCLSLGGTQACTLWFTKSILALV